MTVRPILFSGPMVLALLEGRKTQTRRVIRKLKRFGDVTEFGPSDTKGYDWHFRDKDMRWNDLTFPELMRALPCHVGDLLYVREAWYAAYGANHVPPRDMDPDWKICPAIDWNYADWGIKGRLRPGMHMPRWASRITLKVTDVRVQRLRDISEEDAIYEGVSPRLVDCRDMGHFRGGFQGLWNTLNEKRGFGWDANPWVIAVSFEVIKANVDTVLSEVAA